MKVTEFAGALALLAGKAGQLAALALLSTKDAPLTVAEVSREMLEMKTLLDTMVIKISEHLEKVVKDAKPAETTTAIVPTKPDPKAN